MFENFPNNNLMDNMEGQELKVFWRYKQTLAKIQSELYSSILFGCKSEYIDDPVLVIDILGFL